MALQRHHRKTLEEPRQAAQHLRAEADQTVMQAKAEVERMILEGFVG